MLCKFMLTVNFCHFARLRPNRTDHPRSSTISKYCAKKLPTRITLLRRLADSGWGAGAKIPRTAALSLVYFRAEYCAPVWCSSAYTRLIDNISNDALRIVTKCLRPTPTDHLPILSGTQPAELRRLGAALSLAKCGTLSPDHILRDQLAGSPNVLQERPSS